MQLKNIPTPKNARIATVYGNTLYPISNMSGVPLSYTNTQIVLCCTTYQRTVKYN